MTRVVRPLRVFAKKIAAVLFAGALLGGVAFIWRRHAVVAANLPIRPSLQGWPSELNDQVDEATAVASGYIHSVRGLIALSRLYHANGFYNAALSCYDGLRVLEPGQARWWHLEANILAEFGRATDAIPLYREAIARDPQYRASRIKLGELLLRTNRPDEAAKVFDDALQADATNAYAWLGLAQISSARSDWASARTSLESALRLQPDFVGALSLLITVDQKLGDAASVRSLRETLGSQEFVDIPDPWVLDLYQNCYDAYRLSVLATTQRFAKNYTTAIELLERASQLAPQASSYQRELGLLFADMGRYAEAKPHALKATELSPNDPYPWTLLVRVLTALKEDEAAWRAVDEGLGHCPNSQDLHLVRAHRLLESGRAAEAVAEFKETHRLWPSEASPLVELAQAYLQQGKNSEAQDALREALERQPGSPAALTALTVYYIQSADKDAAAATYRQLAQHAGAVEPVLSRLRQGYQDRFGEPLSDPIQ